ncbi:MAG: cysteine desulfurase family protein [Filifactoraceae bacterium]
MKLIYLDNSGTTRPFDEVIEVMCNNLKYDYFNPSSAYKNGIDISKKIEGARIRIAKVLDCDSSEVMFTSGGTESINTAINCACKVSRKKHIITSAIEHDATLKVMEKMEKDGYRVTYLKANSDGSILWSAVEAEITDETFLVSLMQVNNELGSITNIDEIGRKLYARKIMFHVDAVQGFLKQEISVRNSKISMLSISAHKVNGPKGVGALYVSKDIRFEPLILGGGQESGRRSGTENVVGIIGFEKAVELHQNMLKETKNHYKVMKDYLIGLLKDNLEDYLLNSHDGADNIVNISFLGTKSEVLLNGLASKNILVSSGSACSSKKKSSHVLNGIGLDKGRIESAIRISFGISNTLEEISEFVSVLKEEVNDIRRFTKYKKGR